MNNCQKDFSSLLDFVTWWNTNYQQINTQLNNYMQAINSQNPAVAGTA